MDQPEINIEVSGFGNLKLSKNKTLLELKKSIYNKDNELVPIVGAFYNNRITGLDFRLKKDCKIKFISTEDREGLDIYRNSLSVLLHASFLEVIGKDAKIKIEHSLSKGYFYSYTNKESITENIVKKIEKKMRDLVKQDIPFEKIECDIEDALELFESIGAWDRYYLLKYSDKSKVTLYKLNNCINLSQGHLVPRTGYLKLFSLIYHQSGLILTFPQLDNPKKLPAFIEQKKLYQIYSEQREWSKILDVESAGKLNQFIIKGKIDDLIWVSEGLHEKKTAQIADIITKNANKKRIILLAGPSSSGKTTFAKRLKIHLLANGICPEIITLDNYFIPRHSLTRNKNGEIDFDDINAMDIDLINTHLRLLLKGDEIKIPKYDFKSGTRIKGARTVRIRKNQIVIIEGIHGMNEELTSSISKNEKFKIFISALTQLNLDLINRIPTSTVRLIRRIVRDNQFRGYPAKQTILKWPLVRKGEEKNIFPYQEDVDIMFNSSLVYEMTVLKGYVEPLLKDIEDSDEVYTQAKRLLQFTSNFLYISPEHVPLTSILREFIGGSGFNY